MPRHCNELRCDSSDSSNELRCDSSDSSDSSVSSSNGSGIAGDCGKAEA